MADAAVTGQGDVAGRLVETAAEALHNVEYPTYSPTACNDHNRWSWRGAPDDSDGKRAMGFLGENGETDHYDEFRVSVRAVLAAVLPLLADEIAERAETILYDGDTDQPRPGYYETLDVEALLRDLAVRVAR